MVPARQAAAFAMMRLLALLATCATVGSAAAQPVAPEVADAPRLLRGWTALRTMDCARCHGRSYDGWAAPSLVASVRDGSRERFERIVRDGDPPRGMPAYGNAPVVIDNLDAIYQYLKARADNAIGADFPAPGPRAP
jgi:cytochrome c55X